MKHYFLMVVSAFAMAQAMPALAQELRVMTFNVRYPNPDDGDNVWNNRRDIFVDTVRKAHPDVLGTQELFQTQANDIIRALPEYRWFGRDRFGGHANEHMGIFYRVDRLRLVENGDFWLSDTPDTPGSMAWGATLPRMVTWGIFETRGPKAYRFLMIDTHFANRDDEDEEARRRSANLIVASLPKLAHGLPVVLTGDFNATPDSEAHRRLREALTDVWEASPEEIRAVGHVS